VTLEEAERDRLKTFFDAWFKAKLLQKLAGEKKK
jgi:hypothetical protein